MDLQLTGKRALVTGSTSGVGEAIASRLLEEGATVIVHGRDLGRAQQRADALGGPDSNIEAVAADLTRPAEVEAMSAEILAAGAVDILVANAGPFSEDGVLDSDDSVWSSAFSANTLSAIRCARALAPAMIEARWGRIITLGTRGVSTPLANMAAYSAAKAALTNATGALAVELSGTGVTANTVSPGVIATDGLREMFEARARVAGDERGWEELQAEVAADYAPCPAGRLGEPADIAAAVAFSRARWPTS